MDAKAVADAKIAADAKAVADAKIAADAKAVADAKIAADAKALADAKIAADNQKALDDKLSAFREDRLAKSLAFDPNAGRTGKTLMVADTTPVTKQDNPWSAENIAKDNAANKYSTDIYAQSLHNPFSGGRYDTTNSSGNLALDAMEQADAAQRKRHLIQVSLRWLKPSTTK